MVVSHQGGLLGLHCLSPFLFSFLGLYCLSFFTFGTPLSLSLFTFGTPLSLSLFSLLGLYCLSLSLLTFSNRGTLARIGDNSKSLLIKHFLLLLQQMARKPKLCHNYKKTQSLVESLWDTVAQNHFPYHNSILKKTPKHTKVCPQGILKSPSLQQNFRFPPYVICLLMVLTIKWCAQIWTVSLYIQLKSIWILPLKQTKNKQNQKKKKTKTTKKAQTFHVKCPQFQKESIQFKCETCTYLIFDT